MRVYRQSANMRGHPNVKTRAIRRHIVKRTQWAPETTKRRANVKAEREGMVQTTTQAAAQETECGNGQSAYPVRRIITARGLELDFVLREFNAASIPFAFGGGTLTETPPDGPFTYIPPKPEAVDPRSLVVDWQDGTRHYRLYVPNGQVTDLAQFTLSRTAPAELPVKFSLNHFDTTKDPWTLFSDDQALEGS